jgi:AraC-like DNA-binding protein
MSETITLTLREVLTFSQKSERVRQGARPFSALSFKATTAGAYVVGGARIPYEQGAVCLVPAGVAYQRESEREDIFVIHFDTATPLPQTVCVLQIKDIEAYRQRFAEALALWQRAKAGDHYRVTAILYELFAAMIASVETECREADYLTEAASYMEKHLTDSALSIGMLAARAFVSPANFRRRFKARFGCAPKQYLERLRMDYAKHLLQTGYYNAQEVALRCGFSDAGYFCTAFRHYTGESVSSFRRRTHEG